MKNPYLKKKVKKESVVEKYLKQEVEKRGGQVRKVSFPGHNGAPDRLIMMPGVLIWVELKSETGVLSVLQHREHAFMISMGQPVQVIRKTETVDELIDLMVKISDEYIERNR